MRHMLRPHVGARTSALGVLAHWKLDEASGNALDSVGSFVLSNVNAGVAGSLFAVPAGTTGARTFNGSSQYFQRFVNDSAVASSVASEGCVSSVFRPDSVSGKRALFTYEGLTASSSQSENKIISIYTNGTEILVEWEHGAGTLVSSQTTGAGLAALGTYQLVVSWSGASSKTLRIYLFEMGSGLIHEQTFSGLTGADGGSGADMQMGRGRDDTSYFDGTIDDVVIWKYPLTREAAFMLYAETFGVNYDEETLYSLGEPSTHLRVKIANEDGDLVDLTALTHDHDLVVSATVSDDIDSPGAQATVTVAREIDGFSLAPDVETSPLNKIGFSYAPLLGIIRRIVIETAVIPEGMAPNEWDWVPLFDGFTSSVNWGPDEITVQAGDKMGPLFDTFIGKVPTEIAELTQTPTTNYVNVITSSAHGLSAGDRVSIYNTTNYNGRYTVRSIIAGNEFNTVETIGGSPALESSGLLFGPDIDVFGSAAGTDIETVMQDIIDSNEPSVGYVGGLPSVYTPTSPGFTIKPYFQKREPVQSALETLSQMIGWSIKYRWDSVARDFRLTLHEPERTKTTPDYTFTNDEVEEIGNASINGANIRNAVEVIFSDSNGTQDGAGNYPRVLIRREDAGSISAFGYRLCQISEASTSQIDTYDEANDLAGYVLSDLSQPKAEISATFPFRRFVDLGDLYRIPADDYHWTSAKDVAVVGYNHTFQDGEARTSLSLRGKPASANSRWTDTFVQPGGAPNAPTRSPISPDLAPVIGPALGGAEIASPWNLDDQRRRTLDIFEIHISTTPNFIPGPNTFHSMGRNGTSHIFDLDPATTYYVRTKARDKFGNFSGWSPQATLVPRYMMNVPCTHVHLSATQDIPNANTPTTIQFDDIALDTRGNFDDTTYTYTVPVDGVYSISCQLAVNMLKSNESATVFMYEVGNPDVLLSTGSRSQGEDQTPYTAHPIMTVVYHFTAGTELVWKVEVTNAGADVLDGVASVARSHLSVHLVSQDDP